MRTSYAARLNNPSFNIVTSAPPRFNLLRVEEELSAVHLRLARVYVENRPYESVIDRFDRPDTFFYLDPPYYGCEDYYGPGIFSPEDFVKLKDLLLGLKGKFILSINDAEEIRSLFREFKIEPVETTYTAAGGHRKKPVQELLIRNFG